MSGPSPRNNSSPSGTIAGSPLPKRVEFQEDSSILLARAGSELRDIEEYAEEESDELRDEEQFLDLPRDREEEEVVEVSRRHLPGRDEEEPEYWTTESEDSEDEVLDLRDTGERQFNRARVLEGRREAMVATVRRDLVDVSENLQYLDVKVNMRLQELKQVITQHEKKMAGLRSALNKASAKEMNQILAAGWSRKGDFGLIDIETILRPFAVNQQYFPKPRLQSAGVPDRLPRRMSRAPLLTPPKIPRIRGRRFSHCLSMKNFCFDDDGKTLMGKKHYGEEVSTTSSSEEEVHPLRASELRRDLMDQLQSMMPDHIIDRGEISTFVKISTRGELETNFEQIQRREIEKTPESLSTSSVSSEDLERIERTIKSIPCPQICGVELDGMLGKLLKVESAEKHQEMVRRKLRRYYRNEKRFRKGCVGILPGGLSVIGLSQPPEPKYPAGGLTQRVSSVSSEEILSDILSELGEADSEEDFAELFEKREKEMIEAAATDFRGSLGMEKRTSRRSLSADIFTTTFQIGVPPRKPNVLIELQRLEAIQNEEKEKKEQENLEGHIETIGSSENWCSQLDVCGMCVERIEVTTTVPTKPETTPAEVTEFWQLSHDAGEPLWIFRGRVIKPIEIQS